MGHGLWRDPVELRHVCVRVEVGGTVHDLGLRFICDGRVEIEGEWRFGVSGWR
jgi:hypothetical protein